eukprot:m.165199 g.165199  ORF g.165199 m.165199 type:complete len:75 (-) comp18127_c0_seq1:162-386(-)
MAAEERNLCGMLVWTEYDKLFKRTTVAMHSAWCVHLGQGAYHHHSSRESSECEVVQPEMHLDWTTIDLMAHTSC